MPARLRWRAKIVARRMNCRHCRHENNERIGLGELTMKVWKTPRLREICVGMEINSYACARL